jgi:predicted amidohydrolase
MENLNVAIVQFSPSDDAADNREVIREAFDALDNPDLIVLPEYSAWFHKDTSRWQVGAEPMDGRFVQFLAESATRCDATIIAGFLVEDAGSITNTAVAVTGEGLVGRYDKVHLYDAFGALESAVITAGDPAAPPLIVDVKGWSIGVQTCYDLRFPESSRRLVDAGATVLAIPSDWVPGPLKSEHWRTMLAARAIENVSWVVAANHAEATGIGESMIIDPLGVIVAEAGTGEAIRKATLDADAVLSARRTNPALRNRRYGVQPL